MRTLPGCVLRREATVPATLSLFLQSEKISALLQRGKGPEYRPFRDFRSVPDAVHSPFSYTEEPPNVGSDFRRDRYEGWIPHLRRIPRVSTFDAIVTRDLEASFRSLFSSAARSSSLAKLTMWGSAGRRLLQRSVATDVCTRWHGSIALVVRYLHSEAPKRWGFLPSFVCFTVLPLW
jgi:hypothetical protein